MKEQHNHDNAVNIVKEQILNDKDLSRLSDLFGVFGDFTRIKILNALSKQELCVYDIKSLMNITQSAVSHQLRVLKQAKLVKGRRQGKEIFYSLIDNHVVTIINQGIEHIGE